MGRARGTHGRQKRGILWTDLRERDQLEDPDIDGRIILKSIFKKLKGGMDWIDVAQGTDRW